jgi:hypothetical protein
MTLLLKPVRRRTTLDPKLGRSAAGEITVTLYPGAIIGFRKLKSRSEVRLPLASCYAMALKAAVQDRRKR